jgi:hypothetical protein
MSLVMSEPDVVELEVEQINARPMIGAAYTAPPPRGEQRTPCGRYAQAYPELGRDALRLQTALISPVTGTERVAGVILAVLIGAFGAMLLAHWAAS